MTDSDLPLAHSATEESTRLAVLRGLHILDTPPENEFETIVECAQRMLGTKIALLSLVDEDRQWFKAKWGIEVEQTSRADSFCAHAIKGDDLFIIPNATLDSRFAVNPLVLGAPNIRFYAGMPIRAADHMASDARYAMGTVCIMDDHPRDLTEDESNILRKLGALAESLLAARALASQASILAGERGLALQRLDITHRQFRQAERMANIGSWRLTLDDNCAEWSDQVYAIHGLEQGKKPGLDEALAFYLPQGRAELANAIDRTIETGDPFTLEVDLVTASGLDRRVRAMGELELRHGKPVAVIGVLQDITARYRMEQQLRRNAARDDLTGLANRAHFNDRLDAAIEAARSDAMPLALALIDLDHFKAVNDTHGHRAGDDVLRTMATRLNADYLGGAFAARLGGDEFVLLLAQDAVQTDIVGLLHRLSDDLRKLATFEGGLTVSATIGAAWLTRDVRDRSDLLHRADIALYEAKRQCRGTVRFYGQEHAGRESNAA